MDYKLQPPTVYESTERLEAAELEARKLALEIEGLGHPWVTDCEIEVESDGEEGVAWQAHLSVSGQGLPEEVKQEITQRLQWLLDRLGKTA